MGFVREAGTEENPAIARIGRGRSGFSNADDEEKERGCSCRFLKSGWFWAIVIVVTTICIAAPIGVKTTKRLNDPVTDPPNYRFSGSSGLNTTVPEMYETADWGLDSNGSLSCKMVQQDLPTARVPQGTPPPPLRVKGDQLVAPDGSAAELHGINWFGFNNGKTMVDGLDGEKQASWEGGDFATVVYTLRLLGFNAVRLPFLFGDLLSLPPADYSKPCPPTPPAPEALAARASDPVGPPPSGPAPPRFIPPEGYGQGGRCNSYLPGGTSTLARFLWVVEYFVANGFYVLVDYHPHGADLEPGVLESVQNYVNSWLRVWMALTCLPGWERDLRGRVFLDLLNEPDGVNVVWGGNDAHRPLEDHYLAVMDAIDAQSPGQALFFIQGGGQDKLGTSWGDGFATDPKWIKERRMSDATGFFKALAGRPYKGQVVLAPHLYGVSVSKSPDTGKLQWEKYAVSWGYLQKQGFCGAAGACQRYPVVAGEIGTSFADPLDTQYYADLAAFMKKKPETAAYPSTAFNNWFWWSYNANSGDTGGLVGSDWQTLNWDKLRWLRQNVGLKPWYAKK